MLKDFQQKRVADLIEPILTPKLESSPFDGSANDKRLRPNYPIFSGI